MKTRLFKLAMAVIASVCLTAQAVDNSIYVDQAGDNAAVTITQDGAGNVVRGLPGVGTSNQTPAKIYGEDRKSVV